MRFLIILLFTSMLANAQTEFIRSFNSVADLLARNDPRGAYKKVMVLGYYAPNDGGGGLFTATLSVASTNRGTRIFSGVAGWSYDRVVNGAEYDVRWFGAKMDGTDATTFINNAISSVNNSGGGVINIPPGTIKADGQINLLSGVSLSGSGIGVTTLNQSSASVTDAFIYSTGSLTLIPSISVNIEMGDTNVTFASAHGLSSGDIIFLSDTNQFSFSPSRFYYQKGEAMIVAQVLSASSIALTAPAEDSYTVGANIHVYEMTPVRASVKNMTIRTALGAGAKAAVKISLGNKIKLENLEINDNQYAGIYLDRCVDFVVKSGYAFDGQASIGNNYGLLIGNSQSGSVSEFYGRTTRHGVSLGAGTAIGNIPNRHIQFNNCGFYSLGLVGGFNSHGNTEKCSIMNSYAPSGVELGGDWWVLEGNEIGNLNNSGYAITEAEAHGLNWRLEGNVIKANRYFDNSLVSILARGTNYTKNSVVNWVNNTVDTGLFTSSDYATIPTYQVRIGYLTSKNAELSIVSQGNIHRTEVTTEGQMFGFYTYGLSSNINILNFVSENNKNFGTGLKMSKHIQSATITDFKSYGALWYGIQSEDIVGATFTNQDWQIIDPIIIGAKKHGILLVGDTNSISYSISGGVVKNNSQGSPGTYASIAVSGAKRYSNFGTSIGDDQDTKTQGNNFVVSSVTYRFSGRNNDVGRNKSGLTDAISTIQYDLGGNRWGSVRESFGTTIPSDSTLTNRLGDIHWNVSGNNPLGWMCTASGAPGTWVELPPISSGNFVSWDSVNRTVGIGVTAATTGSVPLLVQKSTNDLVQVQLKNPIATGNTAAGIALNMISGDSSGFFYAFPSDYSVVRQRDAVGIALGATATKMVFDAPAAGQSIGFNAGSTTESARFEDSVVAGETRFLIYDVDNATLERVTVGIADSGGIGFKVLRIPN